MSTLFPRCFSACSVLLLLLASLSPALQAAESAAGSAVDVDPQVAADLVGTLENEAERQALIDKLKVLAEAQKEEPPTGLATLLDFDQAGSGITSTFLNLMEGYGFSENTIGDLITLGITLTVVIIGVIANGWLSGFFNRRLNPLRRRAGLHDKRFNSLFAVQRWAGYLIGLVLLMYAVIRVCASYLGYNADKIELGGMLSTTLSLVVVALVFALIWEGVNFILETLMSRSEKLNNSRFQTITPIIRNILLFALSLLSIMVVLSELGINIVPLLAGAGVLGIAIGFGAQTLVKDFLTGLVIIFEDVIQIGDVIQLGDKFGLVEKITLRKIQLRDLDGKVHTIPFGEVTIVSNLTKDYSFYLFDIGVAYRENTDEVIEVLKEIDEEMRADPDFGELILEPLEVFGVDKFDDSAVVIKARIKTKPIQQWNVGREFNRRIKHAFDARNIEIPFPHTTLYFGEGKDGTSPAANVRMMNKGQASNDAAARPQVASKTGISRSAVQDDDLSAGADSSDSGDN